MVDKITNSTTSSTKVMDELNKFSKSFNTLDSAIQPLLSALQSIRSLAPIDSDVTNTNTNNQQQQQQQLNGLCRARLHITLAYTVNALFSMYLRTQGVDPTSHPIAEEIVRVQDAFLRLRKVEATQSQVDIPSEIKNQLKKDEQTLTKPQRNIRENITKMKAAQEQLATIVFPEERDLLNVLNNVQMHKHFHSDDDDNDDDDNDNDEDSDDDNISDDGINRTTNNNPPLTQNTNNVDVNENSKITHPKKKKKKNKQKSVVPGPQQEPVSVDVNPSTSDSNKKKNKKKKSKSKTEDASANTTPISAKTTTEPDKPNNVVQQLSTELTEDGKKKKKNKRKKANKEQPTEPTSQSKSSRKRKANTDDTENGTEESSKRQSKKKKKKTE